MNISLIIDLLLLATLVFIAVKLHKITGELSRIITHRFDKVQNEDKHTAGQTINVNLSPYSNDQSTIGSPINIVSENPSLEESEKSLKTDDEEAPREAVPVQPINIQPNGVASVKCKSCQAENSTYRRECFQCGKSL
ncbi:MAG: hypothetical protein PF518_11855 [Spirochaetaceae bacterium]|jgi:hypothetical protein|nr:hypothetical protein [Spirochaetaceae bacterium]